MSCFIEEFLFPNRIKNARSPLIRGLEALAPVNWRAGKKLLGNVILSEKQDIL